MAGHIKPRALTGTVDPAPRPYEAKHAALARSAAAQGMVLLKNEGGALPLKPGALALFGAGAVHTVKGGTGSGDVNERASVSVEQGLREAGFALTTDEWLRDYDRRYASARTAWRDGILAEKKRLEEQGALSAFFAAYSASPFRLPEGADVYATQADTAVYVIARVAGENADRRAEPGDYFLSDAERAALEALCGLYEKVVVVVNAGGVIDLGFLDELPVRAVLVASQPGMEGGRAVADVLTGAQPPCGKLTDTWAMRFEDYPNAATFSHRDGHTERELYVEDIYVGYRWFDSFGVKPRYGFGFGLSYTAFSVEAAGAQAAPDGTVTVTARVTNTGDAPGREAVQLYAAPPAGRLEKEVRRLAAFAKTGMLKPGESETLALRFAPCDLASYDEQAAAWVLEAGEYVLFLGASLDESRPAAALELGEEKTLLRTRNICPLRRGLDVLRLDPARRAARLAQLTQGADAPRIAWDLSAVETLCAADAPEEPDDEAARIAAGLTAEQLVLLATGDPGKGQESALGSAAVTVPGAAAETSSCAEAQGVASIALADGPAGLRLTQAYYVENGCPQAAPIEMNLEGGIFWQGGAPQGEKRYQFCTAFPVGTLLAQTWDTALLERVGEAVGEELKEFGVQLWLAPGMNIHRNPLCGRNFEYFSEDPLVSGLCAAAVTRGVQSRPGVGTTIKHFACNNQEDNRMASDSVLTERALREIYLRGFGIAVQKAHPMAIMTSYNFVNGVHAANCADLCTQAARCEFGFDGVIMTDWTTTNVDDTCTAAGCIRAGNDVVMPGLPMDHENLRAELKAGTLTEAQLRACVTRLIRVVLRTDRYET